MTRASRAGHSRRLFLFLVAALLLAMPTMTASAGHHGNNGHHGDHHNHHGPPAWPDPGTYDGGEIPNMPPVTEAAVADDCSQPSIDMKALILTTPTNVSALPATRQTLDYLGMPYDVWVAGHIPGGALTLDKLARGDCEAFYQAVFLTDSGLSGGSASLLSPDEWQALTDYEAQFRIRQVTWNTFPTEGYGFQPFTGASGDDLAAYFTYAGRHVFDYMNASNPVRITNSWTYFAKPLDGDTTPLLTDRNGNALAAVRTYPNGRENLSLTFDTNQYLTAGVALGYGLVDWATRGVFLGQRQVYMSPQIDDVLIDDDVWTPDTVCTTPTDQTGATYRITDKDMAALKKWQSSVNRKSDMRDITLTMAFNGYGATDDAYDHDRLTPWVQKNEQAFYWVSHTWDHESLDPVDYDFAMDELSQNDAIAKQSSRHGGLGLSTYETENLVTPDISGLVNEQFLAAAAKFGIRYVVSDTSRAGYDNPTPNTGLYNQFEPSILMIPRRPVNLFYNVSTPEEWVAEYNCIYAPGGTAPYWDHALSYSEILDFESDILLSYMVRGEMDPWMFHQPNLRAYDGRHSLLSDLLDATLAKYRDIYDLPVQSPTMDQLGQQMADRMNYNAADVSASIIPGRSITLTAKHDVTVPVTGLNIRGADSYGGETVAWVHLRAGQSVTYSLGR